MNYLPILPWCRNDAPHPEHYQHNQFNGRDYCSGRPEPIPTPPDQATDDERESLADEALWDFADELLDAWGIEDENPPGLTERFRDMFVARFRREAPAEPAVTAERDALAAVIEQVREARGNHPECDRRYEDDPVSCGWKRAVQDIDAALRDAPSVSLAEHDAQVLERFADTLSVDDSDREDDHEDDYLRGYRYGREHAQEKAIAEAARLREEAGQ